MTRILVTGATGYVGGRLVPLLLGKGYEVRVFVRTPAKLEGRPWAGHANLEIVKGDVLDEDSLREAMQGCSVMYYLVHSMTDTHDFSEADRLAAYNVTSALQASSIQWVIYLSGVIPHDPRISLHLKSRAEVARVLRLSGVPVTVLQACQIIGVGSASFEMLRYLVDRLPFMITPSWVNTRTQPISMTNVLGYLVGVLDHPETAGETYDIGGPDIVTYRELLTIYNEASGLPRRRVLAIPGLPLGLSAVCVGLLTPVPYSLARALVEGLRNEVVCSDTRIRDIIPQELFSVKFAVERALGRVRQQDVDTSWRDAGMPDVPEWLAHGDPSYAGGTLHTDAYSARFRATPEEIWPCVESIGGETGWYSQNFLWEMRGIMDRLMGGPGVQRGRRCQTNLLVGDCLDFWRVMEVTPHKRLLLLTEMRLPGEGLLDITLVPVSATETDLIISLYYRPRGLTGQAYWYSVMPFHSLAFKGMLKAIAEELGKPLLKKPERIKALPLNRAEEHHEFDARGENPECQIKEPL